MHQHKEIVSLLAEERHYTLEVEWLPDTDRCAELVIRDQIDDNSFVPVLSSLEKSLRVWLTARLPPDCTRYAITTRWTNGTTLRRDVYMRQQVKVGERVFPFQYFHVTQTGNIPTLRYGRFRFNPPAIPEGQQDVVLEQALCDELAKWYGSPLERIEDSFEIGFSLSRYRRGHPDHRVEIDGTYYYFESAGNENDECREFTVTTPLAARDTQLEALVLDEIRKRKWPIALEPITVHFFLPDGQGWKREL